MAVYSISDLEKLSGIKAHTIRMWEKRYDLIQPERTSTNIRYYKDKDLRLLINVAILKRNGFRISQIAAMSHEKITAEARKISSTGQEDRHQLDALTIAMIDLDEYAFDDIINSNIEEMGFERTMLEVIYPLLDKLSLLWITGAIKPVQENFMSYAIRQKIIVAIEEAKRKLPPQKEAHSFLIYLPEGESQELSLLFMNYLIVKRHFKVVNIGQNITFMDVQDACEIHSPDFIFTMMNEEPDRMSAEEYIKDLSKELPDSEILITGYQAASQDEQPPSNVHYLRSLQETIDFLDSIKN